MLGLTKTSTKSEITKAYRKASLTYHPDKSPNPEDAEHFLKIQAAYEALSDDGKRAHYEKYGPVNDPVTSDNMQLITILVTYFAKFLLAIFITGGAELALGRTWLFNFLLASCAAELLLVRMGERDLLSFLPFIGDWPVFQQVWLIGSLYPVMLTSCIVLSRETYHDADAALMTAIGGVVDSTKDVIKTLRKRTGKPATAVQKIEEALKKPKPASNKWWFLSTALSWLFWVFVAKNGYTLIAKSW